MKRPSARSRFITWAVIAAAVLVAALLTLVAVGELRISSSPSAGTLTVSEVQWTILQGTIINSSTGWFGPSTFNYTNASGFPLQVAAGSQFIVPLVLSDLGGQSHPMCSALASSPFSVVATHPTLPVKVPAGEDDAGFSFTIQTPNSPGAVLVLGITLNALSPANCAG